MAKNICCKCQSEADRIGFGLTRKFFGFESKEIYCIKCLSVRLDYSIEYLEEMADYFKQRGCALFS